MSGLPEDVDALQLLEVSPDLYVVGGVDGVPRWANEAWRSLLGWSPDEVVAEGFLSTLLHPADLPSTVEAMGRLQAGEEVRGFRNRYRARDGGYRWLEWVARPLPGGRVLSAARDVTEAEEERALLRRRLAQLELAEQVGRTGSWFVDAENQLHWSDEVFRIHGRDPAEGEPSLEQGVDFYHPEDRPMVVRCVQEAMEGKRPFEFELRLVRADGEVRFVQSIGRPELDADGEVVGLFGVFRDLTDDERRRRHEELELYAHALSHDMREPARTVGSFLPLLLKDMELTDDKVRFARFITEAAGRMTRQIDDLLRYTRAGVPRELGPVELQPILQGVVEDLSMESSVEFPAVLPCVVGEPSLLRQVFVNLLQNAKKYASDERPLRVRVLLEPQGDQVVVHVEDNGIGFPPRLAREIFAPFKRAVGTSVPGTGMGLALVARMTERCGGQVWASAVENGGARFSVKLNRAGESCPSPAS